MSIVKKMRLEDLNFECQIIILEKLCLLDLISVAATNEHFHIMAADVFRRLYAVKSIDFHVPYSESGRLFYDLEDKIQIEDYVLMLLILQYFGHTIRSLEIDFENFQVNQIHEMNNYTNKFCSESLKQLVLTHCKRNSLDMIQQPFKNVENVTFTLGFEKLTYGDLTLDEMFPNVRRLELSYMNIADINFILRKFHRLEHFTISFLQTDSFTENDIEKFIGKNPHIRGIKLINSSFAFLNFLNENLPKLEELELHSTVENQKNYDGNEIHFKNVKRLVIKSVTEDSPEKLKFDQLEELQIDCYSKLTDKWMDFVVENKKLRKFGPLFCSLNHQQLLSLAKNLPNLTELATFCEPNIRAQNVYRIIGSSKKLNKLKFFTHSGSFLSKEELNKILFNLNEEWEINIKKFVVSFNKKVYNY